MLGQSNTDTYFWVKIKDLFPENPKNHQQKSESTIRSSKWALLRNACIVGKGRHIQEDYFELYDSTGKVKVKINSETFKMRNPLSQIQENDVIRVMGKLDHQQRILLATLSIAKLENRDVSINHIEWKKKEAFYTSKSTPDRKSLNSLWGQGLDKSPFQFSDLGNQLKGDKRIGEDKQEGDEFDGYYDDLIDLEDVHDEKNKEFISNTPQTEFSSNSASISSEKLFQTISNYQGISFSELLIIFGDPSKKDEILSVLQLLQELGQVYVAHDLYFVL